MGLESESRKAVVLLPTCGNCEYAIFCPTWGDFKCTKFAKWIKEVSEMHTECYEKYVTPVLSKKCNCEDCFERGYSDEMED